MSKFLFDHGGISAAAVTYGSTASTVLFWGLHLSDIAVFMSATASVCGVLLQFYVTFSRIRKLEQDSEQKDRVIDVITRSQIASKIKSKINETRIDAIEETRKE